MRAEQLRASVLQLAIQGKLLPQLECEPDTPRTSEIAKKTPFSIPQKWKWIELCHLLHKQPQNGKSLKESANGNIKVLTLSATTGQVFRRECFKLGTFTGKINDAWLLKDKDILIQRGNSNEYVGTACLYRGSDDEYIFPDLMIRISADEKKIDSEFLVYVLNSPYGRGYFRHNASGTSQSMPKINQKIVKSLLIPVPSIQEQIRITNLLNELTQLIDTYGQEKEQLEELEKEFPEKLRASLLQEAIQGKLVPQLENEPIVEQVGKVPKDVPFAIPVKWKWCQLKTVFSRITSGKNAVCEKRSAGNEEWGVIKTTAIQEGEFLENENKVLPKTFSFPPECKIDVGDFLMTKAGPINRVGICCIVKNIHKKLILSGHTIRLTLKKDLIDPEFLRFVMHAPAIRNRFMDFMTGMASSQVNLRHGTLGEIFIPLPPLNEQQRIVAKLNELLDLVTEIKNTFPTP